MSQRYLLISPCRNEAQYMRRTLESVVKQSLPPTLWLIVDDGSTDATPAILTEYTQGHNWIKVVTRADRGRRAVGPGVIEAFYAGLERVSLSDFDYICKLDLDLDLPHVYFEQLIHRMEVEPRLGSCSGKPWFRNPDGTKESEKIGDEMSAGMTKFYRTACFEEIGGFVREVMWDGIDCHKSRLLGWKVRSFDDQRLKFEHLRPMGSSENGILTGRTRHGFGQYYMGTDPFYMVASAVYRMAHPPYLIGGLAMIWGYARAWLRREPRHNDAELRAFIRSYQRRALLVGKSRAIAEIEAAHESAWQVAHASDNEAGDIRCSSKNAHL